MSKLCIFQRFYLEQILYRESNGGQDMPEARFPIGTQFQKDFPGFGIFKGKVKAFDGMHYHVVYEDGDSEDMTEAELAKLKILSRQVPQKRKSKTPAKKEALKPENTPPPATNNSNNNNNNSGNPIAPQTSPADSNKPRYPVGTVFAKVFPGHGCYVGRVTAFDGTYYKVYYSYDKDEEDFEEADFNNVTILTKEQQQ